MKMDNLLYINEGGFGIKCFYLNNVVNILNGKLKRILNDMCICDLTTLKGRLDATKEKYHIYKNIPIYINDRFILVPIKEEHSIFYINYPNIIDVKAINKKTSKIIFINGSSLILQKSKMLLENRFKNAKKIDKQLLYENVFFC